MTDVVSSVLTDVMDIYIKKMFYLVLIVTL